MGKFHWILIPLLSYSYGCVAAPDKLFEASQAYQAGEFEQSLNIYEDYLQTPLLPWEAAFIKYNIGVVYLASHQDTKSIAMLNSISLDHDPSPLLVRDIKLNLAVAYLQLARQAALHSLEAFSKVQFYLWEAQAAAAGAQEADCLLVKAEGGSACAPAMDLVRLQEEIKVEFARMMGAVGPFMVKITTLKEGLPMLLIAIRQMEGFAVEVQKGGLSGNLLNDYLHFGRMKGEEWLPLWEAQASLLQKGKNKDLFLKAKDLYSNGLNDFSANSFEASAHALLDVMHAAYGGSVVYEQLQKLMVFYQAALLQDPLQISMLSSLEKEAEDVVQLLPAELKSRLDPSNKALSQAAESLRTGSPLARLFLLKAYREAELLLRTVRPAAENPPRQMLEDGIEDQRFAIIFNRQLIKLGQAASDSVQEEEEAQKSVVADVEGFYEAAMNWQKKAFPKEGCQYQPWDEVFPLFDQGYQAALQATSWPGEQALLFQGRALDAWQEALQKLKHPKKSSASPCKGSQQAQPPPKGQPERPDFDKVAGQLLRMNEEDRQPKPQQVSPIQVERPW